MGREDPIEFYIIFINNFCIINNINYIQLGGWLNYYNLNLKSSFINDF